MTMTPGAHLPLARLPARGVGWELRTLDLAVASVGTTLYAPLICGAMLAIRFDDGGPALFRQERLGRRRARFVVLKLRTMSEGQVTRVGRWLRPTGLDEVTQFLNVLKGEMRMVGPRPLTSADVERLGWDTEAHELRFQVPPGITGLAQLFGGQSARHSYALDRLYLRRSSVGLDVYLIFLSFLANVFGKRAVRRAHRQLRRRLARRRRSR